MSPPTAEGARSGVRTCGLLRRPTQRRSTARSSASTRQRATHRREPASGGDGREREPDHRLRPRNPFRITVRPGTNEVGRRCRLEHVGGDQPRRRSHEREELRVAPLRVAVCGNRATTELNLNICETLYAAGVGAIKISIFRLQPRRQGRHESDPRHVSDGKLADRAVGLHPATAVPRRRTAERCSSRTTRVTASGSCSPVRVGSPTRARGRPSSPRRQPGRRPGRPGRRAYYADFDGGTIRRIAYFTNQPPVASATATPTNGPAPLQVAFNGTASSDPGGAADHVCLGPRRRRGLRRLDRLQPSFTYTQPGTYTARLRVTDPQGASTISSPITITANNTPPTATITAPAAGTTWDVDDSITRAPPRTRSRGRCPRRRSTGTSSSAALSLDLPSPSDHVGRRRRWLVHHVRSRVPVAHRASSHGDGRRRPDRIRRSFDSTRGSWTLSFETSPSGLQLTVGGTSQTTPFNRTVIRDRGTPSARPRRRGSTSSPRGRTAARSRTTSSRTPPRHTRRRTERRRPISTSRRPSRRRARS